MAFLFTVFKKDEGRVMCVTGLLLYSFLHTVLSRNLFDRLRFPGWRGGDWRGPLKISICFLALYSNTTFMLFLPLSFTRNCFQRFYLVVV